MLEALAESGRGSMVDFSTVSTLATDQLLAKLDTAATGLTRQQAKQKLQELGQNQLTSHATAWWKILLRQLSSPFIYLLIGAGLLSILLGEKLDGLMIFLFILINTSLGFIQEYRSEKTVALLNSFFVAKATCIRDGQEIEVEASQLVPGDVLVLKPGMIISADLRMISGEGLLVDESTLTGESAPVSKLTTALPEIAHTVYAAKNCCFSGTTVVSGSGHGVVFGTGNHTNLGKLATLSAQTNRVSTFEKQINKLSQFTLGLVALTLALMVGANVLLEESADLPSLLIFSIALAVSVIPEALPVVITFSLSVGAQKLAKQHVLVKRLSAIEDLGSIEVLCSDKTGTLTENKLTVSSLHGTDQKQLLWYGAVLFADQVRNTSVNPFQDALTKALPEKLRARLARVPVITQYPFDPIRRRTSKLVTLNDQPMLISAGTPEDILQSCDNLSAAERREIVQLTVDEGKQGKRVLALAVKKIPGATAATKLSESKLQYEGLLTFLDPIKPSTYKAIEQAKHMGVQVKILTGDSREVAGSVAHAIRLITEPSAVLTGDEFEQLSAVDQLAAIAHYHVFARVTPEQKYHIVQLLQQTHEVGFLGEGINDAPALKVANVAVVVEGASDIARESADIVLRKKSLKVIIDGIWEGRSVFANTSKYITATLSANFGNFFAVALASLVIDYLPMLPLQILLVNLLSDFPMISVATDTVDHSELTQPSKYDLKNFALIAVLLGIVSTTFDFAFFGTFVKQSPATLQTAWFMGSILTELVFMYSVRTKGFFLRSVRPSNQLLALSLVAAALTLGIPFTPMGATLFSFITLSGRQLMLVLGITLLYFVSTEATKLGYYWLLRNQSERKMPASSAA